MTTPFSESTVEEATLDWLAELGYATLHGPEIAPEEPGAERQSFGDVILVGRLQQALARINPQLPVDAIDEVVRKVTRTETPSLVENNHRFHQMLVGGVDVQYTNHEGRTVHDKAWLVDFTNIDHNDWVALNQFTVIEGKFNRRPDVVLLINGLPLVVIELKNPADENVTTLAAFNQLQTYKLQIPSLLAYNCLLVVSDGIEARLGTLTADWERFAPWRTIDGQSIAPKGAPELEVLLRGVFQRERLLDLIRYFIVFEVDGATTTKKVAAHHLDYRRTGPKLVAAFTLRSERAEVRSQGQVVRDTQQGRAQLGDARPGCSRAARARAGPASSILLESISERHTLILSSSLCFEAIPHSPHPPATQFPR